MKANKMLRANWKNLKINRVKEETHTEKNTEFKCRFKN